MSCDCDLLSTCSYAAYIAVQCTKIPRLEILSDETGKPSDFDIVTGVDNTTYINVQNLPIYITVYKVSFNN